MSLFYFLTLPQRFSFQYYHATIRKKDNELVMDNNEIDNAIKAFMHSTVFTGVKPLFLVAEELATKEHTGDVIDAVWADWSDTSENEFSYITKFAVKGRITERNIYSSEEMEPFKGRLALPTDNNLEKVIMHRLIKDKIKAVNVKRNALSDVVKKDLESLAEVLKSNEEVYLFKRWYGEWTDPFYDIEIDMPYRLIGIEETPSGMIKYLLEHPKTAQIRKYSSEERFYAYITGGKADIAGLQLKDESYKKTIEALKEEARDMMASIEWLSLTDPRLISVKEELPNHPFDEYFKYVKKGDERKLHPPEALLHALELIIEKHMPALKGPMGIEYIPIDNLLYLLHEVIPRPDALLALEACDVIHEPSALVLGFEGKRELPPKFLVPVSHVAYAYQRFPAFIEACERYLREDESLHSQ